MKQVEKFIYPTFYVSLVLVFFFARTKESFYLASSILIVIALFLLLLYGIRTIKAYGAKSIHGKALAYLVAGLALSIIWTLSYQFTQNFVLFNIKLLTVSNLMGIATYILIFFGLLKELKQSKVKWTPKKIVSTTVLILVLMFVILYFGFYQPALEIETPAASSISEIFIVFINLLLVALAVLLFTMVREYDKGKIVFPWLLIMAGFFTRLMGDVAIINFLDEFSNNLWPYLNVSILWPLSYVLYGHGFYEMKKVIDDINNSLLSKKV